MTALVELSPQVIILAAGSAGGLRPISTGRPKALCPVCNVTVLGRLVSVLALSGIKGATLALPPASATRSQQLIGDSIPQDFHLAIHEPNLFSAGSAATLREVLNPSSECILVIYGDSLLSVDFNSLAICYLKALEIGCLATILYHRPNDLRRMRKDGRTYHGVLSVDGQGVVTRFEEKPLVDDIVPRFDLANAAVFMCKPELFELQNFQSANDISFDIFQEAAKSELLAGCDIGAGYRIDIGRMGRFYNANIDVLNRRINAPIPGFEVGSGVFIEEGATYSEVKLVPPVLIGKHAVLDPGSEIGPDVVVGRGCIVSSGAVVRRSILMEECLIGNRACIDSCVLASGCRIGPGADLPAFSVLGEYGAIGYQDFLDLDID